MTFMIVNKQSWLAAPETIESQECGKSPFHLPVRGDSFPSSSEGAPENVDVTEVNTRSNGNMTRNNLSYDPVDIRTAMAGEPSAAQ